MNDVSSRSHAVFLITVEQMRVDGDKQVRVGKLNLVDLAGSESVRVTGATGKRLEESKSINKSLSCLGNVIAALTDSKSRSHIPYRDSKLTRLLKDSLGGNCKTTMMVMISPAPEAFSETISTLKFATRAKKIKNNPTINEDLDQRALLRKYESELKKLKSQLANGQGAGMDPEKVRIMEQERRQAEEDKVAAINALEVRSREYMVEREEKKRLEEKIKIMNSQMLHGGEKMEETDQFRNALAERQKAIRDEYDQKLLDIENERKSLEEDKSQVDRYKQLLIKQRDIMIALTNRLNERDETIIYLQEELDAYDKIHRETEMGMENKSGRVEELESYIRANGLSVPEGNVQEVNFTNPQHNLQRYAPYRDEVTDGETEVPLRLLSGDEKINELNAIIYEMKEKEHMPIVQPQSSGSEEIREALQMEEEKANHLQREKKVISEILQGDILNVAQTVAQQIHDLGQDPVLDTVKQSSVEVYQKISELINSVNQSIDDMNKVNESEASFRSTTEVENLPPAPLSVDEPVRKLPLSTSSQNEQDDPSQYRREPSKQDKAYERRLPPNVEAMLRQKREQLANQLNSH